MRADLNKQLCERERFGHDRRYKNVRRNKKLDSLDVSFESMKRRHTVVGDTKTFNENLNPLWGAVRKAVGKPWNKFYSELCKNFDKRSVINQHILQHLNDRVEQNVYIREDGELMVSRDYGKHLPLRECSYIEYYVDPRDGILKVNKHRKTYKQRRREDAKEAARKEAESFRKLDKDNVLRKIDGIWYHFTLKDVPRGRYVYEKPYGQDEFKDGNRVVSWDRLQSYQKERYGIRRFEGESAFDIFTGDHIFFDGKRVRIMSHGSSSFRNSLDGRYHATKKTASHKVLKKAGLV